MTFAPFVVYPQGLKSPMLGACEDGWKPPALGMGAFEGFKTRSRGLNRAVLIHFVHGNGLLPLAATEILVCGVDRSSLPQ